jgi:hypothetical protein
VDEDAEPEEPEKPEESEDHRHDIPVRTLENSFRIMNLSYVTKRPSRSSFYIVPDAGMSRQSGGRPLSDVSTLLEPELSPLDKLKAKCWDKRVVTFSEVYPDEILADSRKVGEGAFGEVYLLGLSGPDKPVLKVVPVGGEVKVNDENQAGLTEMLSEVVISNALSSLRHGITNYTQGTESRKGEIIFNLIHTGILYFILTCS